MTSTEGLTLDDECMSILRQMADEHENRGVREVLDLALRLARQICLLADNPDLAPIRQMDWHLKVNSLIVLIARRFMDDPDMSIAKQLIGQIAPQYAEGKRRQDKKAAWLRTHPNGDQR